MKKYFFFIIVTLLLSAISYGQCVGHCTTVTATLTDSSTQVWANAIVQTILIPPFNYSGQMMNSGVPVAVPHSTFTADGSGSFSISLDDNLQLAPSGSQWRFIMCPNSTVANCNIVLVTVSGGSMNLSTTLSSQLTVPVVNTVPTIYRAYQDSEALGGQGAIYWRVSDNTLRGCQLVICPGTGWIPIGGGGGGGVSITAGVDITVTPSPITGVGVVSHTASGVTPGSYTNANITVDAQGHVTVASNGSSGSSCINNALQFSPAYYSSSGSANCISGINPPTTPNGVPYQEVWIPSGGVATIPQIVPPGLAATNVTGTTATDIIVSTDCNPKRKIYTTSVSVTITLPTATTLGVPNCLVKIVNGTTGTNTTLTITATTWSIFTPTGSGVSSIILQQNQEVLFTVDASGSAWDADITEIPNRAITFNIGCPSCAALTGASTDTSYVTVPFSCNLQSYDLILQPSGTVTVKFWKVATGTSAPTSGNSISTGGVSISSGTAVHSTNMSDFTTTTVNAYDRMAMNVTAAATTSYVNGVLKCGFPF